MRDSDENDFSSRVEQHLGLAPKFTLVNTLPARKGTKGSTLWAVQARVVPLLAALKRAPKIFYGPGQSVVPLRDAFKRVP